MEFSTFGSDPPTHPPNVEKKIKFWPSKWAFQTIRNKKIFHPLKVEKYLENFHTHPKEDQRVRALAIEKGKHLVSATRVTDNDSLLPLTCTSNTCRTHPGTDIECYVEQPPPTPKKVKKFYAFKLIIRLPEAI